MTKAVLLLAVLLCVGVIGYMIREYILAGKREEEREKEHIALMEESSAITERVRALKQERAYALVMGNKELADEIGREIDKLITKQIEKLLGR